jgi:DNA-directed RNA polymerase specialized sigma subunit
MKPCNYDEYEMTCKQVAEKLGLTESCVYEIDRRARIKIRTMLAEKQINVKELLQYEN